jgi:NDP-sugar pyrophosphorylase family protein
LIGRGARIGEDSVVGEAVIAEGATVSPRARVHRSVLLGHLSTTPGEVVVGEFRAVPRGLVFGDGGVQPCCH